MRARSSTDEARHEAGSQLFAGLAGDLAGIADDRPPLVFLHGLTFDRSTWAPVLDELAHADPDRRVLNLDLPGHGQSRPAPPHSFTAILTRLRRAVDEAGLQAPVVVGHSMSGGLASLYASANPARGVINVDAPPDLATFARLLQSVADQILGPGFAAVWQMMANSFHLELLSPAARLLVESASRPEPDLVRSYWRELLTTPPEQLQAAVAAAMRGITEAGLPYLLILGAELPPAARAALKAGLPDATVQVWSNSGHFPHLANPRRFAEQLAASGQWQQLRT
jgi:pimeloyl-ACP methyl ester carboxylesterase